MTQPAFAHADEIERSLELAAERGDPTEAVYTRLFAEQPQMQALFWRDSDGAVRGEMLSQVFAAILDFVGERRYAALMIGNEIITHEGYDVPREVFATFFGVVARTLKDELGPEWTAATDAAWTALLAELDTYVQATPRVGAAA